MLDPRHGRGTVIPPPPTSYCVHMWVVTFCCAVLQLLSCGLYPYHWKADADVLYYRGMLNGANAVAAAATEGVVLTPWRVDVSGHTGAVSMLIALEELMLWCLSPDPANRPSLEDIATTLSADFTSEPSPGSGSGAATASGFSPVAPAEPHEYDDALAVVRARECMCVSRAYAYAYAYSYACMRLCHYA